MSTIEPTTDNLIVQRGSDLYTTTIEDMSTIQDDDLVMIGRGSESYKINGKEFKEQAGGGGGAATPEIFDVALIGSGPGFDNETYTTNVNYNPGNPAAALSLKAKVDGALSVAGNTGEIVGIEGSTSSFAPVIYTGNSGTQDISCGFAPDLVWLKQRDGSENHRLYDSVRGALKTLYSDLTSAQAEESSSLTSFNSDGFSLGDTGAVNSNGSSFVAWCWDAGDTTVTNNDGATEATVRSNGDFSVVKAALGSATTLGHGLNSIPAMVVSKSSSKSSGWFIHLPGEMNIGQSLSFNTAGVIAANIWSGVMTDKVINFNANNQVGGTEDWIFYCWAESPTQNFGTYTGNASNTGPVIDCGFGPAFVMVKNATGSGDWVIVDTGRDNGKELYPNLANAESSASYRLTITSSGFQVTSSSAIVNDSGATFIYAAFGAGSPNTTLTLASDENLSNGAFVAGDAVKQNNSPVVPVSSPITNVNGNVLTLQNASGLSDFQVGDVVEGYTSTDVGVTGQTTGTNTVEKFVEAWDTPGGSGNASLSTTIPGDYVEFSVPQAGTLVLSGGRSSSIDVNITATGDFTGGDQDFIWIAGLRSQTFNFATPGVVRLTTTNSSNGIYINNTTSTLDGATFSFADPVLVTAINSAAPSITTDGGTWNTGEVVTGPSTDITATFVSADPLVPSMTVNYVVGPWSANTGNFVENTVVNPITVEPESSAIAAVSDLSGNIIVTGVEASYQADIAAAVASASGDMTPGAPMSDNVNVDGTVIAANLAPNDITGGATTAVLTFSPPIETTTVLNVYGGARVNNGVVQTKTVFYSDGTSETQAEISGNNIWYWVSTFNTDGKSVSSVSMTADNDNVVGGVTLGDNNFITATSVTTLTLTDDTDLNQFATGDAVYANGVAPQSFAPVTYTGTGSTQSISCGFAPDLVWIKNRSGTWDHNLVDTVQGPSYTLISNKTDSSALDSNVTSFNPDGFSVASNNTVNKNNDEYVSWCWDAGDTTVTNNDGTIESQVRSNGNFSIVKYTGVGTSGTLAGTVGHGLSNPPSMIILKDVSSVGDWKVLNVGANDGSDPYYKNTLNLNLSDGFSGTGNNFPWGGIAPTSTTFGVGNNSTQTKTSGALSGVEYIAYCWTESPTQSFGSFNGIGTIDCGFEPAFLMMKRTDASGDWIIVDNARNPSDPRDLGLFPNESESEQDAISYIGTISFTSTGFSATGGASNNGTGTYIYAAFAGGGGPTGVVGDITSLDMTLSESTGVWEVGQTVTMDPKAVNATTGYLNFDSGTGNVESILLSDPGFKPSPPNNALNFVDPMTGQTWDEELPAGTTLSTKVQAVNALGSSTSDWASITPVPLTTNMTTAELNAAYTNAALLIATFDNRHKVHCGNKAEEERDALITKLAEAGYSITKILDYL